MKNNRKWENAQHFGKVAETTVADYYVSSGYKIKKRNFASRFGEIDVIAQKSNLLVFIEVKARDSTNNLRPCEYVTPTKQKKILKTALCYLAYIGTDDFSIRFDVVEVIKINDKLTLNCIENAFDASAAFK